LRIFFLFHDFKFYLIAKITNYLAKKQAINIF